MHSKQRLVELLHVEQVCLPLKNNTAVWVSGYNYIALLPFPAILKTCLMLVAFKKKKNFNVNVLSFYISLLANMVGHFGELARIRHVITYSLSPFEQRAFPNYFSKGIPNVWRRFRASVFKVAPREFQIFLFHMSWF